MAGPGLPSGSVVEAPVGLVDVAPTLLALTGLPALPETSGIDLRPAIEGRGPSERVHYVETLVPQLDFGWSPLLGVRSPSFKYIRAPRPELYDLSHDARETRDLSGERPDLVAELDALLAERLAHAREGAPLVIADADHREHLEALGYVVPEAASVASSLESAQGLDPKDGLPVVVGMIRAMTLMTEHRFAEALAAMEGLGDGGWFLEVQRSYAALGAHRLEDAERYARAAVELGQGQRSPPYLALGSALERRGDLDAAATAFEKALSDSAVAPDALVGLGRVAERKGDLERASAFYEQAIASRGSSREAQWRLAALHIEAGDGSRGEALLAELPARTVETPAASVRLAEAEAHAGMPDRARERLSRSREAWPHSREVEEAWKNASGTDPSS
jgi:hypothetical protein